ncbi:MAG: OsmC family peroxiredoxin [Sphingobacteriales bacterium]|nr:MAG: OsmC family peroxiredoxin [Sphingobacteriales bacterium]
MPKQHRYKTIINWTGNKGAGTSGYRSYDRAHTIFVENKAPIYVSSDPAFMGDHSKYNPEELLLASLSSCHMLWYLHLCSDNGVVVVAYEDKATGTMEEDSSGSGKFTEVVLNPFVKVQHVSMMAKAKELHAEANKKCFIANSCNFPVKHQVLVEADD